MDANPKPIHLAAVPISSYHKLDTNQIIKPHESPSVELVAVVNRTTLDSKHGTTNYRYINKSADKLPLVLSSV